MDKSYSPSPWKAVRQLGVWQIVGKDNEKIATIEEVDQSGEYAKLIASSPFLLEALKSVLMLIGDEDLPDNGELSGAAICDMARVAVELTEN
ncbi:hypothetical protein ACFLWV_00500 [Chloroflexota bacterium]